MKSTKVIHVKCPKYYELAGTCIGDQQRKQISSDPHKINIIDFFRILKHVAQFIKQTNREKIDCSRILLDSGNKK